MDFTPRASEGDSRESEEEREERRSENGKEKGRDTEVEWVYVGHREERWMGIYVRRSHTTSLPGTSQPHM